MAERMADRLSAAQATIADQNHTLKDMGQRIEVLKQTLADRLEDLRKAISATGTSYIELIGELQDGPPLRRRSTLINQIRLKLKAPKN
jgi:hypothetical protein